LKVFAFRTPACPGAVYWGQKAGTRHARNPEDAKLGAHVQMNDSDTEHAKTMEAKWQRIETNDTENLPYGLIFAWAQVLVVQAVPECTVL
jgi:hypothetical protein